MSKLRILAVLVVVMGLASFELFTGFSRLSALRERRSRELLETVTRGHEELARRLQALLATCERQARYLAELPDVAAAVTADAAGPAELRDRAEAALVAFLHAFTEIEGALLLDARRRARVHLARAGDALILGAGPTDDQTSLDAVLERGLVIPLIEPDGPAHPPFVAAPVAADDGLAGWVVLSISPEPLQAALAGFHPVEHLRTRLVPDATSRTGEEPAGDGQDGVVRRPVRRDAESLVLVSQVHAEPCFRLETRVPDRAVESAMGPLGREYAWIVGSMIGVTAVLGLVGVVVLRLGQRAFRLHETEHYLRWIRRVTDRYRALMEGAADMILIMEPAGGLREANAAARANLGLDADTTPDTRRAAGETEPVIVVERFVEADRDRFAEALEAAAAAPGRPVAVAGLRLAAPGGSDMIVDGHFARVDIGDEHVVEVSLRDVTRQRAVERQLQTTERLSSLGLLTAGVAHEINNPLEGIGNYLALLERPGLEAAKRERYLGEVRRGLRRIAEIVQDLLTFARPPLASRRADLRDIVENALGMVRYSSDFRDVSVERVGLDDPLEIAGDGPRLEQVVLNLLLNAGRAMDGRGQVTLTASRRPADDGADGWVVLEVADTGPGIPAAETDRLFDPFYSASGGTGLGLSVSFGIVEAHGGTIRAGNRPGGGAVFTLALPAPDGRGGRAAPGRAMEAGA